MDVISNEEEIFVATRKQWSYAPGVCVCVSVCVLQL